MKNTITSISLLLFLMVSTFAAEAQVTYVNHAASGANDGSSWANAYTDLKIAMDNTTAGEIWIAKGTYMPTTGTDSDIYFTIKKNVKYFGGFDGTETLRSQRDYENNETILSANIGSPSSTLDNSKNLISHTALPGSNNILGPDCIIDGLIFQGATNSAIDFLGENKSVIQNCVFRDNINLSSGGGAISLIIATPSFSNVNFINNEAVNFAGALLIVINPEDTLHIKNCSFEKNKAIEGGAITVSSGVIEIESSIFNENQAIEYGGAIQNGYGVININKSSFDLNSTIFSD
jgi:hypothetical protein